MKVQIKQMEVNNNCKGEINDTNNRKKNTEKSTNQNLKINKIGKTLDRLTKKQREDSNY